jgi:DNA-directed RNA polymerase specialized sigma24 family protein
MDRSSVLTQTTLDCLLQWLDSDRAVAGQKYEQVRRSLIKVFASRGCDDAEGLADETLTRVAQKAQVIAPTYKGNPNLFFYGVAKNVFREYLRNRSREVAVEEIENHQRKRAILVFQIDQEESANEMRLKCVRECLQNLATEHHQMLTRYYKEDSSAKIESRKALAEQYRMSVNALRLKVHRLRESVRQCVVTCLEKTSDMDRLKIS